MYILLTELLKYDTLDRYMIKKELHAGGPIKKLPILLGFSAKIRKALLGFYKCVTLFRVDSSWETLYYISNFKVLTAVYRQIYFSKLKVHLKVPLK